MFIGHRQGKRIHRQSLTQIVALVKKREKDAVCHRAVAARQAAIVDKRLVSKVDAEERAEHNTLKGRVDACAKRVKTCAQAFTQAVHVGKRVRRQLAQRGQPCRHYDGVGR